jgi:hypothetical protein
MDKSTYYKEKRLPKGSRCELRTYVGVYYTKLVSPT